MNGRRKQWKDIKGINRLKYQEELIFNTSASEKLNKINFEVRIMEDPWSS